MAPSSRIGSEFPLVNGEELPIVVARLDERVGSMGHKIDRIADAVLGPDDDQHRGLNHRVTTLESQSRAHKRMQARIWAAAVAATSAALIWAGAQLWEYVTHLHAKPNEIANSSR